LTHDAEIDALIRRYYAAFDNRDGRVPDLGELRSLFAVGACITRVSSTAVDFWTVDEFITPRIDWLTKGTLSDFHEWETRARTTVLGDIASRESWYCKAGTSDGAPFAGEGRKFIQLYRTAERWLIASVLWQDL
jgi:hypothetical protein